jgi:hypothetical protein
VSNLAPEHDGPGHAPDLIGLLITPCVLFAWVVRDRLLDLQLSRRR